MKYGQSLSVVCSLKCIAFLNHFLLHLCLYMFSCVGIGSATCLLALNGNFNLLTLCFTGRFVVVRVVLVKIQFFLDVVWC